MSRYYSDTNVNSQYLNYLIGEWEGLVKSSRFSVSIPDYKYNFFCEKVVFPGLKLNYSRTRINALDETRASNIDFLGKSVVLTLFADKNYNAKKFFDDWMDKIIAPESQGKIVSYFDSYVKPIELAVLHKSNNISFILKLLDAYPVEISPINFSANAQNVVRFNVTFSFTTWNIENYQKNLASFADTQIRTLRTLNTYIPSFFKKRPALFVKIFVGNGAVILKRAFFKRNANIGRIIRRIDSVPLGNFRRITRRF